MQTTSIALNNTYKVDRGWDLFRAEFRRATRIVESSIQAPVLIINVMQLAVNILAAIPSTKLNLDAPRQFCKDAKNILNILKGMKSIDGTLYFKRVWKLIILNVSGISLTILSGISFIDRFKIMNVSVVKVALAALPVIGILPYGGLITISTIGLLSMNILLNLDKKDLLKDQVKDIKNKKAFWQELDQTKIQLRVAKYMTGDQNKLQKWTAIQKNWIKISPDALERYRQAKADKWQAKLDKTELNQTSNVLSITAHMAVVSKQMFALATVVTGFGVIALPIAISVGMDIVSASCDSSNFFLKRYIGQIEHPSIELDQYVQISPAA